MTHCTAANADMCSIFIILDLSSAFGASGRNVVNSSLKSYVMWQTIFFLIFNSSDKKTLTRFSWLEACSS